MIVLEVTVCHTVVVPQLWLNLKNEIVKLKSIVEKFTLSSNKLHMILDNQKAIYDKVDLRYNPLNKQKFLKNIFVNSSYNKFSNITCFKCGRIGYKSYSYFSNKSENFNVKKI